ncbi:MAG: hypothetical protein ACRYFS_17030 [Janthinobacterium lividum]
MTTGKMTAEQIRSAGIKVLRRELGVVGMVRFLQLFETGHGDYTAERHQWLDSMSLDEIYERVQANRQQKSE